MFIDNRVHIFSSHLYAYVPAAATRMPCIRNQQSYGLALRSTKIVGRRCRESTIMIKSSVALHSTIYALRSQCSVKRLRLYNKIL